MMVQLQAWVPKSDLVDRLLQVTSDTPIESNFMEGSLIL